MLERTTNNTLDVIGKGSRNILYKKINYKKNIIKNKLLCTVLKIY